MKARSWRSAMLAESICKTATAAGHTPLAVATTQDWIARCAAAQHSNPPQPFPEAALFRAMAAHDTWLARADFSLRRGRRLRVGVQRRR